MGTGLQTPTAMSERGDAAYVSIFDFWRATLAQEQRRARGAARDTARSPDRARSRNRSASADRERPRRAAADDNVPARAASRAPSASSSSSSASSTASSDALGTEIRKLFKGRLFCAPKLHQDVCERAAGRHPSVKVKAKWQLRKNSVRTGLLFVQGTCDDVAHFVCMLLEDSGLKVTTESQVDHNKRKRKRKRKSQQ